MKKYSYLNSGLLVPLFFALVGTSSIIYSWTSEKKELASANEELIRLQRTQLVIGVDEIGRDQWLIAFNQEVSKPSPNPDILAITAHGALTTLAIWQAHMEMRVANTSEEFNRTRSAREELISKAEKLAEGKDYRPLASALEQFVKLARSTGSLAKLDDAFFARVDAARANVEKIESSIRFWYVFGTAVLLLSTLLSNILLDKSFHKLETQIAGSTGGKR